MKINASWLVDRLSESSTYAGLGGLAAVVNVSVPPGVVKDVTVVGMVAGFGLAVVLKEGWKKALASGDLAKALEEGAAKAASGK